MHLLKRWVPTAKTSCKAHHRGISERAEIVSSTLLPTNSSEKHETAYAAYTAWRKLKGTHISSESVLLVYFDELSKRYKSSTLWSLYFKLKSTININEKVDISNYRTLSAFLKKQSRGFLSKKSNVFTPDKRNCSRQKLKMINISQPR